MKVYALMAIDPETNEQTIVACGALGVGVMAIVSTKKASVEKLYALALLRDPGFSRWRDPKIVTFESVESEDV